VPKRQACTINLRKDAHCVGRVCNEQHSVCSWIGKTLRMLCSLA